MGNKEKKEEKKREGNETCKWTDGMQSPPDLDTFGRLDSPCTAAGGGHTVVVCGRCATAVWCLLVGMGRVAETRNRHVTRFGPVAMPACAQCKKVFPSLLPPHESTLLHHPSIHSTHPLPTNMNVAVKGSDLLFINFNQDFRCVRSLPKTHLRRPCRACTPAMYRCRACLVTGLSRKLSALPAPANLTVSCPLIANT